jgi:hypothetical protein
MFVDVGEGAIGWGVAVGENGVDVGTGWLDGEQAVMNARSATSNTVHFAA